MAAILLIYSESLKHKLNPHTEWSLLRHTNINPTQPLGKKIQPIVVEMWRQENLFEMQSRKELSSQYGAPKLQSIRLMNIHYIYSLWESLI